MRQCDLWCDSGFWRDEMKKVGMAENGEVIAQMSLYEWTAIGGPMRTANQGYGKEPSSSLFHPHALYAHLDQIRKSTPDLSPDFGRHCSHSWR